MFMVFEIIELAQVFPTQGSQQSEFLMVWIQTSKSVDNFNIIKLPNPNQTNRRSAVLRYFPKLLLSVHPYISIFTMPTNSPMNDSKRFRITNRYRCHPEKCSGCRHGQA